MARMFHALAAVAAIIALSGSSMASPPVTPVSCAQAQVPEGFTASSMNVNGAQLHFIKGGTGPAVVLIQAFPKTARLGRAYLSGCASASPSSRLICAVLVHP